ncbi:hypothetical protein AAHC03_09293 [Spirometra sp. Aus1]
MDEPLLPKACLCLLWSESCEETTQGPSATDWTSNTPKRFNSVNSFAGPRTAEVLPNPRVAMLSQSRPRTSLRTAAHDVDGPKVGESAEEVGCCGDTAVAMSEDCDGPLRKAAFLALDMVDTQWVCILTTRRRIDLSTRLVCLRVCPESTSATSTSSIRLADPVFLKAIDAVYVPDSRITVCLEASRSIVLYTGVVKVGFLGVVPSPSAPLQTSPDKQSGSSLSPSFLLPLVVRPSASDVAASSARGQISQLMSVFSTGTSLPSTSPSSPSTHTYSDTALQKNLEIITSSPASRSLSPSLGSGGGGDAFIAAGCPPSSTLSSSSATASPSGGDEGNTLVWRLCLPANRQFTLALIAHTRSPSDHPSSFRSTEPISRSVCRKQLHIQLPPMSSDSLCERCLNGLRRGLPPKVGLDLLVRWFNHLNPPGGYQQLHATAIATDLSSAELLSFSRFLLLTLGLLAEGEETEGDRQSTHALHTPDRLLMKRHRQYSGARDPGGEWGCGMQDGQQVLLRGLVSTPEAAAAAAAIDLQNRDPARWRLLQHLPAILLSLHLVYENEKLDVLSQPQLKPLATVNHILAKYLELPSFLEYYNADGLSNLSASQVATLPTCPPTVSSSLIWPSVAADRLPGDLPAPCLYRWSISLFSNAPASFLHLPGVNDFAAVVAGLILAIVHHHRPDNDNPGAAAHRGENAFEEAVSLWNRYIMTIDVEAQALREPPNEDACADFVTDGSNSPATATNVLAAVHQASLNPVLLAFVSALVHHAARGGHKESKEADSVLAGLLTKPPQDGAVGDESNSRHQLGVLFINELGLHAPACQRRLTEAPTQLPPALTQILQIVLTGCMFTPPSNCSVNVYRLIGREDLARQCEIMHFSPDSPAGKEKNLVQSRALCSAWRQPVSQDLTTNEWSPAERWSNLLRPVSETHTSVPKTPTGFDGSSTVASSSSPYHMPGRHFLLASLEGNPASQVFFPKDLRLQEAYRLLQTSSHIWLPRVCTDESTFGASIFSTNPDAQASSSSGLGKARLDMHLAAACVRTSALPIGKGMLGLACLQGGATAGIPSRLPIYPICLRGRTLAASSSLPVQQDLARGSLVDSGLRGQEAVHSAADQASDHPSNATALAIVTAVVASGTATSIRNACSCSRLLIPKDQADQPNAAAASLSLGTMRRLVSVASNAALAAASAVSSTSILQTPSVLAAKHWPDFHNGVAAGLMVSPHASVDSTWIIQNCKAIAAAQAGANQGAVPPTTSHPYSPTQAGFLLGLGLNGHLNKLSAHYIREFTVQVHDLTNAAVILGLCAGKRGTMDQATLRLLAIHYRPLLTPDPVLVDVSVPSLCQAAAAFGLGLLFQGSAHRQMASILLTELGRPLGSPPSFGEHQAEGQTASGSRLNLACGAGGFAADGRELISLSAGFALGLVMLQRGDTPCGLSDLAVAQTLHAYMTGGYRTSMPVSLDSCSDTDGSNLLVDTIAVHIPRPLSGHPLPIYLQPHLLALRSHRADGLRMPYTTGPTSSSATAAEANSGTRNGASVVRRDTFLGNSQLDSLSAVPIDEMIDLGLVPPTGGGGDGVRQQQSRSATTTEMGRLLAAVDPLDSLLYAEGSLLGAGSTETAASSTVDIPATPLIGGSARAAATPAANATRTPTYAGRAGGDPGHSRDNRRGTAVPGDWNQQIREGDTYNCDVSGPGAIIALGFIYLATGNETVSQWLNPPNTLRGLDAVRPDMLMLMTIAYGLINWWEVGATSEWVQGRVPPYIRAALQPVGGGGGGGGGNTSAVTTAPLAAAATAASTTSSADYSAANKQPWAALSSDDDVENRSPAAPPAAASSTGSSLAAGRDRRVVAGRPPVPNSPTSAVSAVGADGPVVAAAAATGMPFNVRLPHRRQPLSPKIQLPVQSGTSASSTFSCLTALPDISTPPPVDYATVSMAYLNILTGACFVIGLKFAGTCDPQATDLLYSMTIAFLNGRWWPPNSGAYGTQTGTDCSSVSLAPKLADLPPMETVIYEAAATSLLALAMVVAGSGNLSVLRMARKLRAVRLFSGPSKAAGTAVSDVGSSAANQRWPRSEELHRTFQVASATAHALASVQAMPNASPSSQPVSTAAILGAALAPNYGLQMVYGSVVGLLFLGGGRLTLSNTPEAAAILTIAFFPRYPVFAGDNWYHLQCLRHLYVLATIPRRVCAVDVATNQVVPANMRATFKDKRGCITSQFTAVLPFGCLDKLNSVEFNFEKSDYLPTTFLPGTNEWLLLKRTVEETGYLFVKRKAEVQLLDDFEQWTSHCLARWDQPATIMQLKLITAFLKSHSPKRAGLTATSPLSRDRTANLHEFLAQSLASQVVKRFVDRTNDLSSGLRAYFLGIGTSDASISACVTAFRIWFSLPTASVLFPFLPKDAPISLAAFLAAVRPLKRTVESGAFYWLHKFLYTDPTDSTISALLPQT